MSHVFSNEEIVRAAMTLQHQHYNGTICLRCKADEALVGLALAERRSEQRREALMRLRLLAAPYMSRGVLPDELATALNDVERLAG